jgi:type I restriction-modification system DNA methylase subunit
MGRKERQRWRDNEKAQDIVQKPSGNITEEDIEFLKESYTSVGGLIPSEYTRGAFFTPTHVAKFICKYLNVNKDSKVLEPSAGAGVFLEYIPESCETTAIEINPTSANIAQLIYPKVNVINGNTFDNLKEDHYDYVIGNPPFGEIIEMDSNATYSTLTKSGKKFKGRSESIFLEYAIKSVKAGGYIAFILPMGISYSQNHKKIRKLMYDTCWHVATISLPETTFQHVGTSIQTQILVLRKAPPTVEKIKSNDIDAEFFRGQEPSLMAEITDIGFDKKGQSTDKWGDGKTQLDELLSLIQINGWQTTLVRESLYPNMPSWLDRTGDVTAFMFWNNDSEGQREAKRCGGVRHWHEMTLGVDSDDGSWDFYLQDSLVKEYYKRKK